MAEECEWCLGHLFQVRDYYGKRICIQCLSLTSISQLKKAKGNGYGVHSITTKPFDNE